MVAKLKSIRETYLYGTLNKSGYVKEETRETHYRTVSTGFGVTKNRSFFNHTNGSKLDEDNLSFSKFFLI